MLYFWNQWGKLWHIRLIPGLHKVYTYIMDLLGNLEKDIPMLPSKYTFESINPNKCYIFGISWITYDILGWYQVYTDVIDWLGNLEKDIPMHPSKYNFPVFFVICDMWCVTCDVWCDTWHALWHVLQSHVDAGVVTFPKWCHTRGPGLFSVVCHMCDVWGVMCDVWHDMWCNTPTIPVTHTTPDTLWKFQPNQQEIGGEIAVLSHISNLWQTENSESGVVKIKKYHFFLSKEKIPAWGPPYGQYTGPHAGIFFLLKKKWYFLIFITPPIFDDETPFPS